MSSLNERFHIKSILKIFCIISVLIIMATGCVRVIESGKTGIRVILGKYSKNELNPGIHPWIPIIYDIKIVDTRVHTINYKEVPDNKGHGVINHKPITVLDQRGLPIQVELTVQYRLVPDHASEMLQEWGDNWEEKLINPICREVIRDVIGTYPAEIIPTKRPEIAARIQKDITRKVQEQSKGAVQVIGVQLRNVHLPPEIEKKIKDVQLAKQEAQRMKYVEEQAKRRQEVKRIEAETKKIQKVIAAQAEAEATLKRAEAIAEANRKLAQTITPNLLKWKELEVQKQIAESLEKNPNVKLFLNTPAGNFSHVVR